MKAQMRVLGVLCGTLLTTAVSAAPDPRLSPFRALVGCAMNVKVEAKESRSSFIHCASPQFSKEVDPRIAERLAFWMAARPDFDKVRVCSAGEQKESGDRYRSDAIGCFEVLDANRVKTGYIFLRNENQRWFILDIKY